jgi:hypothetical protein
MDSKDVRHTVLEVHKPVFQCEIQIRANGFHTTSIVALSLAPYGVFEFIQPLLARPFLSPFKMVAKEVDSPLWLASTIRVLVGCNFSPFSSTHWLISSNPFCASSWLAHRTTKDVGISDHFKAFSGDLPVAHSGCRFRRFRLWPQTFAGIPPGS